jgi:hypothetical protein
MNTRNSKRLKIHYKNYTHYYTKKKKKKGYTRKNKRGGSDEVKKMGRISPLRESSDDTQQTIDLVELIRFVLQYGDKVKVTKEQTPGKSPDDLDFEIITKFKHDVIEIITKSGIKTSSTMMNDPNYEEASKVINKILTSRKYINLALFNTSNILNTLVIYNGSRSDNNAVLKTYNDLSELLDNLQQYNVESGSHFSDYMLLKLRSVISNEISIISKTISDTQKSTSVEEKNDYTELSDPPPPPYDLSGLIEFSLNNKVLKSEKTKQKDKEAEQKDKEAMDAYRSSIEYLLYANGITIDLPDSNYKDISKILSSIITPNIDKASLLTGVINLDAMIIQTLVKSNSIRDNIYKETRLKCYEILGKINKILLKEYIVKDEYKNNEIFRKHATRLGDVQRYIDHEISEGIKTLDRKKEGGVESLSSTTIDLSSIIEDSLLNSSLVIEGRDSTRAEKEHMILYRGCIDKLLNIYSPKTKLPKKNYTEISKILNGILTSNINREPLLTGDISTDRVIIKTLFLVNTHREIDETTRFNKFLELNMINQKLIKQYIVNPKFKNDESFKTNLKDLKGVSDFVNEQAIKQQQTLDSRLVTTDIARMEEEKAEKAREELLARVDEETKARVDKKTNKSQTQQKNSQKKKNNNANPENEASLVSNNTEIGTIEEGVIETTGLPEANLVLVDDTEKKPEERGGPVEHPLGLPETKEDTETMKTERGITAKQARKMKSKAIKNMIEESFPEDSSGLTEEIVNRVHVLWKNILGSKVYEKLQQMVDGDQIDKYLRMNVKDPEMNYIIYKNIQILASISKKLNEPDKEGGVNKNTIIWKGGVADALSLPIDKEPFDVKDLDIIVRYGDDTTNRRLSLAISIFIVTSLDISGKTFSYYIPPDNQDIVKIAVITQESISPDGILIPSKRVAFIDIDFKDKIGEDKYIYKDLVTKGDEEINFSFPPIEERLGEMFHLSLKYMTKLTSIGIPANVLKRTIEKKLEPKYAEKLTTEELQNDFRFFKKFYLRYLQLEEIMKKSRK